MSLETLLEAARFVEQQEKKRERLASSSSSSSDHPLAVAPHSNHHNSNEPRGAKLKRERTEQDDLFCEEKMLIIDGKCMKTIFLNPFSAKEDYDHTIIIQLRIKFHCESNTLL